MDPAAAPSGRLGRYAIGGLLGQGSAARVYAATDERGREVALKILRSTASEDPTAAARLEREAEVLAGLDHPGLVRVLDTGRDDGGRPFLVLERVRGVTLRELVAKEGPLAPERAWRIVRAVALGLRAAHAAGVLHRDLTASNVFLDARERPKLGDFGLAKRPADPRLSRDRSATGTPAYMAPEQWWGASIDERTDVYGIGAILYECLCGQPPWHGDPADVLHRIATSGPSPLRERASVTPQVADFVHRTLARDARDRPRDVDTLIAEGDRAFGSRRRPVPWAALGTATAVLGAALALGFGGSHDPRRWLLEAGLGGWVTLAWAPIALAAGVRWPAWRSLLGAAPLLSGALVFVTGMHLVMARVAAAAPEARFTLFHLGLGEATAGWFLGAALSAALFASSATWPAAEEPLRAPRLRALLGVAAVTLTAILAAQPGAFAVAGLAVALLLLGTPARGPDHALGSSDAVASLALMAWVELESEGARLFSSGLARAERAAELTRIDRAQDAVAMAGAIAIFAVLLASAWRGTRAWPRSRVRARALVTAVVLCVLVGPWLHGRADRAVLWDELAPRFSMWAELDPPQGRGTGPARLGPTLQLGRRRIAVDGEDVAPIAALGGRAPTGPLLVAERLGPRVALDGRGPELVLAADRSLRWALVERALGAAYDLGVRRADVVILATRPPRLDPAAPPAARVVLPEDLRRLEVRLREGDDGPAGDVLFEAVLRRLPPEDRALVLRR